jgi:hypothetical protein
MCIPVFQNLFQKWEIQGLETGDPRAWNCRSKGLDFVFTPIIFA